MSAGYRVTPSLPFQQDIERLEDHIFQRELVSETTDVTCLARFRHAVERGMNILSFAPHTCRRSEGDRVFRELVVPFGRGGIVVLYLVRDDDVILLAARDPHENDYS